MQAKYVHTNLIARDWRKLVKFYTDVFGCSLVPPERDYQGDALDAGTGLKGAHLTGAHLRLPGYDEHGPTLEIYNYNGKRIAARNGSGEDTSAGKRRARRPPGRWEPAQTD